jgi:hypothetical protein
MRTGGKRLAISKTCARSRRWDRRKARPRDQEHLLKLGKLSGLAEFDANHQKRVFRAGPSLTRYSEV